jgi:hypothetical protein
MKVKSYELSISDYRKSEAIITLLSNAFGTYYIPITVNFLTLLACFDSLSPPSIHPLYPPPSSFSALAV